MDKNPGQEGVLPVVNSGIRRTGLLIEVVEGGFGVVEGDGGGLPMQGVNSIAREPPKYKPFYHSIDYLREFAIIPYRM